MLYVPSIFGESMMDEMDDWMRDMDREFFNKKESALRSQCKESHENGYP